MNVLRFPNVDTMYNKTVASEWHSLVRVADIDEERPPYIVILPSHPIEYVTMMPALLRHEFKHGPLSKEQTPHQFEEAFLSCTGGELVRQQSHLLQGAAKYRAVTSVYDYVPEIDDVFHETETVVTKVHKRDVMMRRWKSTRDDMSSISIDDNTTPVTTTSSGELS